MLANFAFLKCLACGKAREKLKIWLTKQKKRNIFDEKMLSYVQQDQLWSFSHNHAA